MEDNLNPFNEEFSKDDVIGEEINDNKEPLLTLEELELYDEQKYLNKKFKNIIEDSNIKKISTLPDELKNLFDETQFQEYEDYEKLRDEEILQKNFKDFLILNKISGNFKGLSGTNRIPRNKVLESKNIIIEDNPLLIDFDEETKNKTTVVTHKNEHDEIEYIEVLCECGSKTVIKFDYDTKFENLSPSLFNPKDYDPNETINAYEIPLDQLTKDFPAETKTEDDKNSNNNENDFTDKISIDNTTLNSDNTIDNTINNDL